MIAKAWCAFAEARGENPLARENPGSSREAPGHISVSRLHRQREGTLPRSAARKGRRSASKLSIQNDTRNTPARPALQGKPIGLSEHGLKPVLLESRMDRKREREIETR